MIDKILDSMRSRLRSNISEEIIPSIPALSEEMIRRDIYV